MAADVERAVRLGVRMLAAEAPYGREEDAAMPRLGVFLGRHLQRVHRREELRDGRRGIEIARERELGSLFKTRSGADRLKHILPAG